MRKEKEDETERVREEEEEEEMVVEMEDGVSEGGDRQLDVSFTHTYIHTLIFNFAVSTGEVCGGESIVSRESHIQSLSPPTPSSAQSPPTWPHPPAGPAESPDVWFGNE